MECLSGASVAHCAQLDTEGGDLVAQSVAVDSQRLGGSTQIAIVAAQHLEDELLLEGATSLFEQEAFFHQDLDDFRQSPAQIVFRHWRFSRRN